MAHVCFTRAVSQSNLIARNGVARASCVSERSPTVGLSGCPVSLDVILCEVGALGASSLGSEVFPWGVLFTFQAGESLHVEVPCTAGPWASQCPGH